MPETPEAFSVHMPSHELSRALEQAVARFEVALRRGERPTIESHLPAEPTARSATLEELVHTELEYRIKAGERQLAEEYLNRFPELADQDAVATGLIAAEYELCRRLDVNVTPGQYLERFPDLRDALRVRLGVITEEGPQVPGYTILGVLGRGGMGVVYKARHEALKRVVALKMVLAGEHAGPAERQQFRQEAEAVARLNHPNIVQVFEIGEAGGLPFLALEYVEGGSLDRKTAGTPLPAREILRR